MRLKPTHLFLHGRLLALATILGCLIPATAQEPAAASQAAAKQVPEPETTVEVQVGGRSLRIPVPAGFVRCDGLNEVWDRAVGSLIPPTNRLLASFGTPEDRALILKGEPADYTRNFNIQCVRSIENTEIGEKTFAALRAPIKAEVQKNLATLDAEVKKLTDSSNKALSKDFGVDAALSISDTAVLGFFEDKDHALGFTLAMKVAVSGTEPGRAVVACLMAPVNGRAVNLYSSNTNFRTEADRVDAEQTVMAWRDAILAANPRVQGTAPGPEWEKLGKFAGAGLGIAVLVIIGTVVLAVRSRRPRQS